MCIYDFNYRFQTILNFTFFIQTSHKIYCRNKLFPIPIMSLTLATFVKIQIRWHFCLKKQTNKHAFYIGFSRINILDINVAFSRNLLNYYSLCFLIAPCPKYEWIYYYSNYCKLTWKMNRIPVTVRMIYPISERITNV